jgi:hypothetical protein
MQSFGASELAPRALHLLACGAVGRHDARGEATEVATVAHRRQRSGGVARVLDDGAIGVCEDVGDGVELRAPLLETRHAAVEHIFRLLPPESRGLASIGVGRGPVARIAIERRGNGGEGVLGIGQSAGSKRLADRAAPLGIPNACHFGGRAAAYHLLLSADVAVTDGDHGRHERRRENHRPPRPPPLARRLELGEQRFHGGKSILTRGRKAARQDDTHAPRHPRAHARVARGGACILAVQRSSSEESLEGETQKLYWSLSSSTGPPLFCSGDMYSGVPKMAPAAVS